MQRHHSIIWAVIFLCTAISTAGAAEERRAMATFAAGCFWCMEKPFDLLSGVISTTSGYTGGSEKKPTYEQVSAGQTGHAEAVQIIYNPDLISYEKLLEVYWKNSDPTVANRQFCDRGSQYRPAIFYHNRAQHQAALGSLKTVKADKRFAEPIVTEIVVAGDFWPAEAYHQDYYQKNPIRYHFYRYNCGRDQRLKELWGDDDE